MAMYLIPATGELDRIAELASKAGIFLSAPSTVRQLIIEANEHPHCIMSVPNEILLILSRHSGQLMTDIPSVVMSIPGLVYDSSWNITASAFHPLDYQEMENKLSKSGLVAHEVADMEKRDIGTMETSSPRRLGSIRPGTSPNEEDIDPLVGPDSLEMGDA